MEGIIEFIELLADDPSDEDINDFCKSLGTEPQMWGHDPHDMNYVFTYEKMAKALRDLYLIDEDEE